MTVAVFIDGAAGTTGLEIRDRLATRDDLTLIEIDEARRKDAGARAEALNDADIAILCLPDDAAREAVGLIRGDTRVIDASSAFRTAPGWTYGLPELGFDVTGADRVSNPGCWPTGFLLLVAPLVRAGLIPADWPLSYSGASGYSGGGKAMIAEFEGGAAATGYRAYGLSLNHKHLPEMRDHAGLTQPPVFLPAVANVYRGMLAEVGLSLHAMPGRPSLAAMREAIAAAYDGAPLLTVADDAPALVRIEENAGSDRVTLRVLGNAAAGQARLIATFDNLGKGAAGAAVQNLNLMAGLDPLAGLTV
ncbi:N-acetyl-gamma-glutamyl-phosphate reductase [Sphingomonas sp.]|uniref:N-acetyl-gamma-glutamyl-phosphate reductase n=1 Tax=Sphingomonas sp. TaxID=28214 RepID=UPI003AFFE02F